MICTFAVSASLDTTLMPFARLCLTVLPFRLVYVVVFLTLCPITCCRFLTASFLTLLAAALSACQLTFRWFLVDILRKSA